MIVNVKKVLAGTQPSINGKHASLFLEEFRYRFNRRTKLEAKLPRLDCAVVCTPSCRKGTGDWMRVLDK